MNKTTNTYTEALCYLPLQCTDVMLNHSGLGKDDVMLNHAGLDKDDVAILGEFFRDAPEVLLARLEQAGTDPDLGGHVTLKDEKVKTFELPEVDGTGLPHQLSSSLRDEVRLDSAGNKIEEERFNITSAEGQKQVCFVFLFVQLGNLTRVVLLNVRAI